MRHPLHPALVHFPIACWSLAVAADFAAPWLGGAAGQWAGSLNAIGCAMAVVAMMAGLIELARVPEGAAMRDAYWHMSVMLAALSLFAARLLLYRSDGAFLAADGLALLLDAGGFLALAVGGWFGGRLVYGHAIGVDGRAARCPRIEEETETMPADEPGRRVERNG